MNVAIGRAVLESDVQAAIGEAVSIRGGFAGTNEQHRKSARVLDVTIEVAVELAGKFQPHLHRRNRPDGGIDVPHIAKTSGVAVGQDAIGDEGERFSGLRLKEEW